MTYDNPTSLHGTFRIACTSGQTLGSRTTETHSASSCTDFIAGKQTVNVVSYQDHAIAKLSRRSSREFSKTLK